MKKILIIDDQEDVIGAIAGTISDELECEIIKATNGFEGLEKFGYFLPDIVICDTEMPGITGPEVIRMMQRSGVKSRIFLKSARKENQKYADELKVEFFWLGGDWYEQLVDKIA